MAKAKTSSSERALGRFLAILGLVPVSFLAFIVIASQNPRDEKIFSIGFGLMTGVFVLVCVAAVAMLIAESKRRSDR